MTGHDHIAVSRTEMTLIRWVEKLLIPCLVLGIGALTTCAFNTTGQVDQLDMTVQSEVSRSRQVDEQQSRIIGTMQQKQEQMMQTTIRTETKVEGIESDVDEIKEILREAFPANGGN